MSSGRTCGASLQIRHVVTRLDVFGLGRRRAEGAVGAGGQEDEGLVAGQGVFAGGGVDPAVVVAVAEHGAELLERERGGVGGGGVVVVVEHRLGAAAAVGDRVGQV